MKNQTVYFVTGGLGFVGFHICSMLLRDSQNKVVVLDKQQNLFPDDKENWKYYMPLRRKMLGYDRFELITGDCNNEELVRNSLETHRPDYVIHLAAVSVAVLSDIYPIESRGNILGSVFTVLNVIKNASFDIRRFIYFSSSMVYGHFLRNGDGKIIPAREEQECNPVDIYGAMKLCGETVVKTFYNRYQIPYTIIRPSAVYGPTDCNKRVTELFLLNASAGLPIVLDNGGKHQLDFTYVDDVVSSVKLIIENDTATNQTFNISRGEGRSIKELADIVSGLVPGTKIVTNETKPYRPNRGSLDISKARNLLGFKPEFNLEKGMERYYDFFRKRYPEIKNPKG